MVEMSLVFGIFNKMYFLVSFCHIDHHKLFVRMNCMLLRQIPRNAEFFLGKKTPSCYFVLLAVLDRTVSFMLQQENFAQPFWDLDSI